MRRRRQVAAAILAVAVVALLGTPAAADGPVVIVYVDGQQRAALGSGDLGPSHFESFYLRDTPGAEASTEDHPETWGIAGLVAPYGAAAVDVVGPGKDAGAAFGIPDQAALSGTGYRNAPGLWLNGPAARTIRPLADDPNDHNSSDRINADPANPLRLYVHTRGRIPLTISVAGDGGNSVMLSVDTSCPVTWELGDGTGATGTSVQHTYAGSDYYGVVANAECGDGTGGATWRRITVGQGDGPPGPTPTASPAPSSTATPAPSPTPKPRATRTPMPKPKPTPSKNGGGSSSGGSPDATATAGPTATAAPSATAAPTSTATATATATATPEQRRRRSRGTPPPDSKLPLVRGQLISAVVAVPPAALAAAPTPVPASVSGGGGAAPKPAPRVALPLGLLVIAALLAAGVWRERRGL